MFWTLSVRTLVILFCKLEGEDYWRRLARVLTAAVAWLACAGIVIMKQYYSGGFNPRTLTIVVHLSSIDVSDLWYLAEHVIDPTVIALAGLGLGCRGEAKSDMVRTRRCIFGMGVLMAGFAVATHNWGQLFKNVVSDIAATIASAIEFQDRPWGEWFPDVVGRMSFAIRCFRSRYLMIRPGVRAEIDAS